MALAETGTRALLGAVTGCAADGDEPALARKLLHLLGPGMLVLMDRAFDTDAFLAAVAAAGAHFLARARATRSPLVLEVLPDGSWLAEVAGLRVRLIEAAVSVTGTDGTRWGNSYRLITTLLDHRRYPAPRLVKLYHERWEIESAYYALRHTLLQGRVLRSGDRPGLEQEIWALLALYQLLRMAMTDAAATRPGTDPDRASFTTALQTAIDTLATAPGITPAAPHPGLIGAAVLATLLDERRPRCSARTLKTTAARYPARTSNDPPPQAITAIHITICPPAPGTRSRPATRKRRAPAPGTPRHHVTALMTTAPGRPWTATELAARLGLPPPRLRTRLCHWARTGLLTRTAPGTYTLPTTPAPLTKPPDP
jgi:hypothetical protein